MPVSNISQHAVCISLAHDELPPLFDGELAKAMVCQALRSTGEVEWTDMEIELFQGKTGALLIARPLRVKPRCFAFSEFETLLSAALAINRDIPSGLTYLEGQWLLSLRCMDENIPMPLLEFGEEIQDYSELTGGFHVEHGMQVISREALRILREKFLH